MKGENKVIYKLKLQIYAIFESDMPKGHHFGISLASWLALLLSMQEVIGSYRGGP